MTRASVNEAAFLPARLHLKECATQRTAFTADVLIRTLKA